MHMISTQEAMEASLGHVKQTLCAPVPGLSEMTTFLAKGTGKGIRTILLVTSAMDGQGNVPSDAPRAAAALELLHMASLVHDDVIDDATTRRGMPALHRKFDTKSAVICGDYLLSQAMLMLAEADITRLKADDEYTKLIPTVSRALATLCKGEYTQHINTGNLNITLPTYLRIIAGKTASLFSVAAYLGGAVGGESLKTTKNLGRFGRCLGMAFQIIDDCKDYEWTEMRAQKPVGSDIKSGVITLPLILAMAKNPDLHHFAKDVLDAKKDHIDFIEAVCKTGGPEAARGLARRYANWAKRTLDGLNEAKRQALLEILYKAGVL